MGIIALIAILLGGYIIYNVTQRANGDNNYSVAEYFPDKEMIKVFDGGYENSGSIQIFDEFQDDRLQMRLVNHGTGVVMIYKTSDNDLKIIFSKETEDMAEGYLDYPSNRDSIILKGPIKKGTKWSSDGGDYEITGVDVNVTTPAGEFKALEVTYKRDDYKYKSYYAKGLGLVKTEDEFFPSQLIRIEYDLKEIENDSILDLLRKYL